MEISIIIVSWNTKEYLERCLASIYSSENNVEFEIIVVDNNSTDDSAAMVKTEFPDVKVVVNSENYGFAKANNIGFNESSGDYLLFLNSDCEVKEKSISKMLDNLREHEEVGMIGPALQYPDGRFQFSTGRFPSFFTEVYDNLLLSKIPLLSVIFRDKYDKKKYNEAREIDWLSGACLLVRREAFAEAGKFDDRFFMYMEDIDLAKKLKNSGWKIIYFPKTLIVHHQGKSSENNLKKIISIKNRSQHLYYRKHHKLPMIKIIEFSALLGMLIRLLFTGLLFVFSLGRCFRVKLKIFYYNLLFNIRALLKFKIV